MSRLGGKGEDLLRSGMAELLGNYRGQDLQADNSYGYPEQILRRVRRI